MYHTSRIVAFASMLAAASAVVAADPVSGTKWRITTSMSGNGMNMPARVAEMCVTGNGQDHPPPSAQGGCQYSEVSRSGSTVSYSVQCRTMKGTGQITYSADGYRGKFDMQSDQGAMSATYEGQKLGRCDASQASNSNSAPSSLSTVGSQVQSGVAAGADEVKAAATDVATEAAQSVKDDATQSVKDKAVSALQGLFGH